MAAIENLQRIQAEAEKHLGPVNGGSSRVYEIYMDGTIVERTRQLRDFYRFIGLEIAQAITLLS